MDDGVREGLLCYYCRLILKDPIQTSETGQRFCKECFKEAVRYVIVATFNLACIDSIVYSYLSAIVLSIFMAYA